MKKILLVLSALILISFSPGKVTIIGKGLAGNEFQKPKPPPKPKAPKKAPKPKSPKKPPPVKKPKTPPKPPGIK
jgi:hypothetical protein